MPKERAEYVYIHHIIFRYIGYVIVQRPESKLNYKYEVVGKYPTKWTDLARKRGTLPRVLDTGTNFSRKAAPHLASLIDVL
jgi:hypothetical protein